MSLRQLPKIELHCHLDCSLGWKAARAITPTLSEQRYHSEYVLSQPCKDLSDFLSRVPRTLALLQEAEHLRVTAYEVGRQLHEDGVIYAEIRFAPLLHLEGGLTPEDVVESVLTGFQQAEKDFSVIIRTLLCTLRHFSEEQGMTTVRLAQTFRDRGVVGIDLASDEAGFSLDAHCAAFKYAREHGINRTAHAGEALGPESVWETLERLQPQRIGHGVRSIEDPSLVKHLAKKGIHLEVCPGCNVQIGIYSSLEAHPVHRLYQAGLTMGINTDGRTLPYRRLTQEYTDLAATFGWGSGHFKQTNLHALEAAFCEPDLKASLRNRLALM